jgi:hypothetical protein
MKNKFFEILRGFVVLLCFSVWLAFLTAIISRALFTLQKMLYQNPGESFYGSNYIIMASAGLALFVNFIILIVLVSKAKPDKLKVELTRNISIFLAAVVLSFSLFSLMGINAYIKLTDDHIIASRMSFKNNAVEYKYTDVNISYFKNIKGNGYYVFTFPDGKNVRNISKENKLLNEISNKIGVDITKIMPRTSPRHTLKFSLSILIFLAIVVFMVNRFQKLTERIKS